MNNKYKKYALCIHKCNNMKRERAVCKFKLSREGLTKLKK